MTNQHCDQVLDYFNDQLSPDEKLTFEEHLHDCSTCQNELQELTDLTEDLPFLSDPVTPPAGLEERIMTRVLGEEPKRAVVHELPSKARSRRGWMLPLTAAILVLSLLGNVYQYLVTPTTPEEFAVDQVLNHVQLAGIENDSTGIASLIEQENGITVVIQAEELQAVQNDEVYQVWLIEDEQPERAGTFIPSNNGTGAVVYTLPKSDKDWDTVAITLEPDATSQTPKGSIVLASEL